MGLYVSEIDPTLADTAAFCAAYEVSPDVSANCVVVAGRRAETTTMAACLVLASDRADVNKTVRKHLDVRKISFAPMEDAVAQTGMEYGGITPVGLPADWPILVDTAVTRQPWLVIGSGLRREQDRRQRRGPGAAARRDRAGPGDRACPLTRADPQSFRRIDTVRSLQPV